MITNFRRKYGDKPFWREQIYWHPAVSNNRSSIRRSSAVEVEMPEREDNQGRLCDLKWASQSKMLGNGWTNDMDSASNSSLAIKRRSMMSVLKRIEPDRAIKMQLSVQKEKGYDDLVVYQAPQTSVLGPSSSATRSHTHSAPLHLSESNKASMSAIIFHE